MSPTRNDEAYASPLPDAFLQELVSMQERCGQLERQLGASERAREGLLDRLHGAEHARDMAEAGVQLQADALREKNVELGERDRTIQRLNLVLNLALGDGQSHMDGTIRELWTLATVDPARCGRKRKFAEAAE